MFFLCFFCYFYTVNKTYMRIITCAFVSVTAHNCKGTAKTKQAELYVNEVLIYTLNSLCAALYVCFHPVLSRQPSLF